MAIHLVYPVGMSHQTLWQQTIIQDDEGMTCGSTYSWKQVTHKGTLTRHYSSDIPRLSLKIPRRLPHFMKLRFVWFIRVWSVLHKCFSLQLDRQEEIASNQLPINDNIRSCSKEGSALSVYTLKGKNFSDNSSSRLMQIWCYAFSHATDLNLSLYQI